MQNSRIAKRVSALSTLGVLLLAAAVLIGCGSSTLSHVLWVAEQSNNRVVQYNGTTLTTGEAAVLVLGQANFTSGAAATSATGMSGPFTVARDSGGNLWVADTGNNRVLKFVPPFTTGMAATLALGQAAGATNLNTNGAATTATGLFSPEALAFDAAGNLWVADTSNNRVLKYPPAAQIAGGAATLAIGQPAGGTNLTTNGAATTATGLLSPTSLAFDATGNLWVVDANNNRVLMYPPANQVAGGAATLALGQAAGGTNLTTAVAATTATGFHTPFGIAFSSTGAWVTDFTNNRTLFYPTANLVAGGTATIVLGQSDFITGAANTGGLGAATQARPAGVAVDSSGRVIVADLSNNRTLVYPTPLAIHESATIVEGQASFTTNAAATTATGQSQPAGVAIF